MMAANKGVSEPSQMLVPANTDTRSILEGQENVMMSLAIKYTKFVFVFVCLYLQV